MFFSLPEYMTYHPCCAGYMTRHLLDWSHTVTTALAGLTDLSQFTGGYTIDPAHSQIGFVARHAMVTKVRGAFDDFDGSAVFDAAQPEASAVTVNIRSASINTRNQQRDEHLRNNDFLAVDEHQPRHQRGDRKSTRLNSSHVEISYAVFCLKKKK